MLVFWIETVENGFPEGIRRVVKFNKPGAADGNVVAYLDIYGVFDSRSATGTGYRDAATRLAKKLNGKLVEQQV